ncbi:MAG: redoxin domain-containing protein [Acidobacteria bacterium]|nr:redoxin domain-containing protein [Acidobacteriota bacterium]
MKKILIALMFAAALTAGREIYAQNGAMSSEPMKAKPALAVGQTAPDFSLTASGGGQVTLSKVGGPAILVFYRGYWCPFCARQLADLRGLLKPGEKFRLFAISVDPAEKSKELATKIASDGKGELPFLLLSDPGYKTIAGYGLIDPAYEGKGIYGIPHPAVYILDKKGKVVWAKVEMDYKTRPTNEEIRAELDKVK